MDISVTHNKSMNYYTEYLPSVQVPAAGYRSTPGKLDMCEMKLATLLDITSQQR